MNTYNKCRESRQGERIKAEKLIKRFIHVARINERIKEANDQTEIGSMFNRLRYNDGNEEDPKPVSEINIEDIQGLLDHIDWIFSMYDMTKDNIEHAKDTITTYIPIYESPNNQGSFLEMRCKDSMLSNYLKNHCNKIDDEELFHYDKESDRILYCHDRWLQAHFRFLLQTIHKLEQLIVFIETGGDVERMEQAKQEKRKQEKREQGKERVECECSMWYSRSNKSKHENTKYHKEWIEEGCPYREGGVDPETLSEEERKKLMDMKMDEYIECACGQGYARKEKQHHITSSFHRGFCKAVKEQVKG